MKLFGPSLLCVSLAATAISIAVPEASAAIYLNLDFEGGTDQGFGTGFGNDASASYPIVSIGGSKRMEVLDTQPFQQAGRETGNPADGQYIGMLAASANEALYTLSYDWYVDTSLFPSNYSTFLALGTYVHTGSGYYANDYSFPGVDVELSAAQLSSGQVFSGTVTETFAAKGFNMPLGETFFRFGFLIVGDGSQAKIYLDNIKIADVSTAAVPEPLSVLVWTGLAFVGFVIAKRCKF